MPGAGSRLAHVVLGRVLAGIERFTGIGRVQTRTSPSRQAVATDLPSGLNTADQRSFGCFSGGPRGQPVATSHNLAVPSLLAVTSRRPSGLNDAVCTNPW